MNTKRQINGTRYNIAELVENAISIVDSSTSLDLKKAANSLSYLGHINPDEETIIRYARESAILEILAEKTGANFRNQIGKIDFSSNAAAITGVENYLNRRIAGQHARWTANHQ